MLGRDRNILNLEDSEENFWPTFTDLLSVIILVILLVLVSYIFVAQVTTRETREVQQMISSRIDEIVGFREKIARDLSTKFADSNLAIDLDETTGAISFSGGVLFETASAEIRREFKNQLKQVIPQYVEVLLSEKHRDNISQIIIEGHTDDTGSYSYNLDLSQRRAANVVKYILGEEFPDFKNKELLKQYITASGKSESKLIRKSDGSINRILSRRVEIKFNITDQYFIDKMREVVKSY
ncbi:MAG: OmpA family protein [Halanaerobiaceae bacterium]